MRVLLDVDGVIADFVQGTCNYYKENNPYTAHENNGVYDIVKLLDMEPKKFWAPLGHDFWATLPKMPNADLIVDLITKTYGTENVCFLTKPCATVGCASGKRAWLKKYYPQFDMLIGNNKAFCATPGAILFDDYGPNIHKFRAAGGRAFLVPAKWNVKHAINPVLAIKNFLTHEKEVLDACS